MNRLHRLLGCFTALLLVACPAEDEPAPEDSTSGAITSLVLNFTPAGGGDSLAFTWTDPEGDGNPEVDPIPLPDGSTHNHHDPGRYTLDVEVRNDIDDIDVTDEIEDAPETYQFFFTGSAVQGPATDENREAVIAHEYDDEDDDGLPVGLTNTITTTAWGSGELTVTLQHMDSDKNDDLADDVADDGFDGLPGETEIQVTFDIEVE